jgi:hypothetical protein
LDADGKDCNISHLTAVFKLRVNNKDRARLRDAMARWHAYYEEAMAQARADERTLLRCLKMWTGKTGKSRLVVDGARLHQLVLAWVPRMSLLHSSCRMSMVVAVEESLKSYLGLYALWINEQRVNPKPAFPTVLPGTPKAARARWEQALGRAASVTTLAEEDAWRVEVTRTARGRLLPLYFGAATSGIDAQAHCGLLRREDGKYLALLTLFPSGDPLGEPVTRARNRLDRGAVANVRAEKEFRPTERARASLLCPLALGRGHEHLFFSRAAPKSAELVEKEDGLYLHVAFEYPDVPARQLTGCVLAIRRGIGTLASAVVLGPDGAEVVRQEFSGRALASLITAIREVRKKKQEQGQVLAGDRRASRAAEHHLYSLGHQVIDLACQTGAEIVLLEDPGSRKPTPFLQWKHFSRLADILGQLAVEAGLPPPRVRKIYGSWKTCAACGWAPGDPVKIETGAGDTCPGCGAQRDPTCHLATLLALDSLRLRDRTGEKEKLGAYIRRLRQG